MYNEMFLQLARHVRIGHHPAVDVRMNLRQDCGLAFHALGVTPHVTVQCALLYESLIAQKALVRLLPGVGHAVVP